MLLVVAATELELETVGGAIETLCCGLGPVEAAAATAARLAARAPSALLHVGVAGATGIDPPAVVIGSEAVYCDILDPHATGMRVARVEPDAGLLAAARRALPDARVLPIGTSARVGGVTGCAVEAMEGFAVLRAAELAGVPAVEVRAVSNDVAHVDRSLWRIPDALEALARALPALLAEFQPWTS